MDSVQLAWAAGFVDGEGCFHIARQIYRTPRRRPTYVFRLSVAQSNREVLRHLQRILGEHGTIHAVKFRAGMTKQPYRLDYSGPHALAVVEKLFDFLVAKKREAEVVRSFREHCCVSQHPGPKGQHPHVWKQRERHYDELRRLK